MKIPLELNITETGTFLNFWDFVHANDVVCTVKDGKLFHHIDDKEVEITFQQFVDLVKASTDLWTK